MVIWIDYWYYNWMNFLDIMKSMNNKGLVYIRWMYIYIKEDIWIDIIL